MGFNSGFKGLTVDVFETVRIDREEIDVTRNNNKQTN
jgi:hypothetical protein